MSSLKISYIFVIHGRFNNFWPKSGDIFNHCIIQNNTNSAQVLSAILATKLCNFTHFKMLFYAVVMDFILYA